ncbi:MAG: hypothetical protein GY856_18080, partial [bacterium]|nr:hypothetical protein [bacterium]
EHYTEEEMIPIPSDPDVAISSGESSVEGASPMKVAGAMLLIAGLALTGAQLFIKEDIGFGLRVNVLPESYLYVGLVGAIIGALLIVGDRIRATSTAPSPMPPRAGVSPQGSPFVESEEREGGIPLQIEHLARLRDQGILSEEEFEQKKKELLARM